MEELVRKFEKLQKYIPFLEKFLVQIKSQPNANDAKYIQKYEKLNQIHNILKFGFKSTYTLTFLNKIENGMQDVVNTYSRKITTSAVKSERIEPDSIKMENDYQSPESPPLHQDFKNEREPITIPTERRDSNNYSYDAMSKDSRRHSNKYDDYKRHNDRRYRERSRSRSRSQSPDYERRSHESKKYRRSRSHSRERRRSRSRDRKYERSRSPSYLCSPSHRLNSPSYQGRSKSPHYRHRSDRRDDRRDERRYDRERDYQPDYDRSYEIKRNFKVENEPDYNRDSKWHINSSIKQENRREYRDEPSTSSSIRNVNPMNRFVTATVNRHPENIKQEIEQTDIANNVLKSKIHATKSRFESRSNQVEVSDVVRQYMKDDDIEEIQHKTQLMFGTTEEIGEIKKRFKDIEEINNLNDMASEEMDKKLADEILNELQANGDPDVNEEPIMNSPHSDIPQKRFEARNEVRSEVREESFHEKRNEAQNDIRFDARANIRANVDSNRYNNGTESRPDSNNQRSPVPISSIVPICSPAHVSSTNPFRAEERIALSDKYHRRPRMYNDSNVNMVDNGQTKPVNGLVNSQQPQQDPRLRNRDMPGSDASLEQFMSYGNPQPTTHAQPPQHIRHPQPVQPPQPMHQVQPLHHSPMQNMFGPNINRNFPNNVDVYQPPAQRPFFNEPYHQHQPQLPLPPQQQPQFTPRTGQHMPSNNFNQNVGYGMNATPHGNVFGQIKNIAHHHIGKQPRETYGDYRLRRIRERQELERARKEQKKKTNANVTSTTVSQPQNTANEQSQESPAQSPNQNETTHSKDTDKEQTSSSAAQKTHFDKAFRDNNWDSLPITKPSSSFKIPKLNKPNSHPGSTRPSNDSKQDPSENNVSTSTKAVKPTKTCESGRIDPRLKKTPNAANKRKISSDAKKPNEKKSDDKTPAELDHIHADTTIISEPDQVEEEQSQQQQKKTDIPVDVLEMIKTKIDPEKFKQIESILTQKDATNDNDVTSSTTPAQANADGNESMANQSKSDTKTPKKLRKSQMNELEKLNADIRENIPDVLSATGRRTCTLNTSKSSDGSPAKDKPQKFFGKAKTSGHKSDDEIQCENDKIRARIARRRNTTVDARPFVFESDETPSESTEAMPLTTRITQQRDAVCEVINSRSSKFNDGHIKIKTFSMDSQPSARNNSINLNIEAEVVPAKRRPGPQSAMNNANNELPKENMVALLPRCSVVLETVDVSKEMQRMTRSSKRRAEQMNSSAGSESMETKESITIDNNDSSTEPKRPRVDVKNNDKTITTKWKRCHICVEKSFPYLSSHYANTHEGVEVYSARMSAKNSDKVRQLPPKEATYENGKVVAYCYYCEKDVKYDRSKWISHFIRHTGEYKRQCNKCGITVTSATEKTATCTHHDPKCLPLVEFDDSIYVYMCNICNYTQYQEENLMNHIRNTHDINLGVTNHYKKIVLIPKFLKRVRANRRALSTTEIESAVGSEEVANPDVFQSNQDDDLLSDSFKYIKENSFNSSGIAGTLRPTTQSIADRLSKRFNNQQLDTPLIKEEAIDAHHIVFRGGGESSTGTSKIVKKPNPLVEGDVHESMCKIEVSKTEANTSGVHSIDVDDTDDWESCSGEDEVNDEEISSTKSTLNTLNRLLMQKQKTSKSRLRAKKRADKSLLSSLKREKIDDVIDLEGEIKMEKPPEIRPVRDGQMRVDNMAFTEFLGSHKFHCFIGNCDFLSVNNPTSLLTHIRHRHSTERWNGSCYACDKQILNGNYSLMKEYDHMMTCHVPNTCKPTPKSAIKIPVHKTPEPSKPPVEIQRPQVEAPEAAGPKIRIRRLSGDMLSGGSIILAANPMQLQQPILSISSAASIPFSQQPKFTADENLDQFIGENPLKPWTKCINTKTAPAEAKLKRECSLVALFKCMAIGCIFTTSDKDKMLEHLYNHEDFLVQQASYSKHHSNQDDSSWLECCYCEEIPGSCTTLVDHIIAEHAKSIFQCLYCFYRSVDQKNVASHLKRYHCNEEERYILVCGTEAKSLTDEINLILRGQLSVKMFQCPESGCNAAFMHLFELNVHSRNVHADKTTYTCTMCSKVLRKTSGDIDLRHLHEHGFSLCHCAYCSFHSLDMESMRAHLRDDHSTMLPYSFMRISNGSPNTGRTPSLAYFGDDNDNQSNCSLVYSPLTDSQLNFMNSSLAEYATNACDPPHDEENGKPTAGKTKQRFDEMQRLEQFESTQLRKDHNIKTCEELLLIANRKTSPNEVPINPLMASERDGAIASTSSSNEAFSSTDYDILVQTEIDTSANILVSETGVESHELYRCAYTNCNWVRADDKEFLMHLLQHQGETMHACYHCNKTFTLPIELKNHIKSHLKHRFFCFYCDLTTASQQAMNEHFKMAHKNNDAQYFALNPVNFDIVKDLFVACPKGEEKFFDFITQLLKRVDERKHQQKKSYKPEELDQLPNRQIYAEEIQCGNCSFSTKVRSNLVRHFRQGCIEIKAPVNPVPHLNTGDRYSDKMRNLAASSNSNEQNLGKFVQDEKRYVCGAKSCQYQTLYADMLQKHIVTLHGTEKCFECPHCGTDLSNNTSATEILNHLRYHEAKIHKCPCCQFIHYLKPHVEKHINEMHSTSKDRAITVDRSVKKVEPPKPVAKVTTYKWMCYMCSKIFNTRGLVKSHVSDTHRLAHQFKCTLCSFSNDTKTTVKDHLNSEHHETDPLKIKSHYDRVESEADNSPIWRRDDPTRIKHIRGILFDDAAEKSRGKQATAQSTNLLQSIHLEIKPVKFTKPISTTIPSNKKAKDDSALTYKVSTKDSMTTGRFVQQNFDIVAQSTNNDSERFVILPPKENVEEEVRPRPASLRQQPKRRFSMYIPSSSEMQSSTSTMQPPISLRLKRISDPVPDEQRMPPPKVFKLLPVKKVEKVDDIQQMEPLDLSSLDFIYKCNYCITQVDTFDKIHNHWLTIHKRNQNDPVTKRFSYRVTQRVKCVYCAADVTFQTIRTHMEQKHPNTTYAFKKYEISARANVHCGICSEEVKDVTALQIHFRTKHAQNQRPGIKTEALPTLNDAIIEALLQQGDRGTFKCNYCCRHFPCRYDFEQHHNAMHTTEPQKYETNGKDVIKYGCTMCREMYTDENLAIDHLRTHVPQWFQCLYCPKKVQFLKLIQTHHELIHNSSEVGYRCVNARENLNTFDKMTLTFSNGLTLIWGDVLNTKYGGVERLVKYLNELNEAQRQQQIRLLKKESTTTNIITQKKSVQTVGKIGGRRPTLL